MPAIAPSVRPASLLVLALLALSCAREAPEEQSASARDGADLAARRADIPMVAPAPQAVTAEPAPPPAPASLGKVAESRVSADAVAQSSAGAAGAAFVQPPVQPGAGDPMLIRTGGTSIEVASLEVAIERVRRLAGSLGGFVASTSAQTGSGEVRSATLELRLPAARFDEALSGLRPLGEVESVNVQTQDVGEEYVDITARVTTARQLEDRLVRLLATRTGKLDDVLAVERELARVRGEIERMEGRLRWLRARVEMSTLQVSLHEPYPVIAPNAGPGPLAEALRQAWRNLVALTAAGIASLGFVVPLAALGVVIGLGIRRWRRAAPAVTVQG